MAKHIGYDHALSLAGEKLAGCNPQKVAENTGVEWDGEDYVIPWLGSRVKLADGSPDERIIWMHYLLTEGPKQPRGRFINYKQVPGAAIYNSNFVKRAIDPMAKAFGQRPDAFLRIGLELGGEKNILGDTSFTLKVLPFMPVTYILWQGDDEFPANGNILFDEGASEWLCAEDLVVLASLPVYRMLRMQ